MKYEDMILRLTPGERVGEIQVVRSPAGEGRGKFSIPFDLGELKPLLTNLSMRKKMAHTKGQTTLPWFRDQMSDRENKMARLTLKRLGGELYRALLQGEVERRFLESLTMMNTVGRGLRIVLDVDPRNRLAADIFSLPWEYLYREETGDFLTLSRHTPLVRYLNVARPPGRPEQSGNLRILAICSSPHDMNELALATELKRIVESWAGQPGVEVETLLHPSLASIRQVLLTKPFQVIHFMGHGDWDPRTEQGILYMERPDGSSEPISGERFATFLKDFKSIRMAFLNACTTGELRSVNPFAGVASAMVLGGIPAVLAMQFPISDYAAIVFGNAFYRRLAAGDLVDAALAEGRLAIHGMDEKSTEWGTPVYYSRMLSGLRLLEAPSVTSSRTLSVVQPTKPTKPTKAGNSERGAARAALPKKRKRRRRGPLAPSLVIGTAIAVIWLSGSISLPLPGPKKPTSTSLPIELVPSDHVAGQEKTILLPGGVAMTFVWIPAGRFQMGSSETEPGHTLEERRHQVIITRGFWLQTTETTQAQWTAMGMTNRSERKRNDFPVTDANWFQAKAFTDALSLHFERPGFRLPTEAEWEYACRAGTNGWFAGELDEMAWYEATTESGPMPVAGKQANAWGLYDMHGNVWEWCSDWWQESYPKGPRVDPRIEKGTYKALRGGSYLQKKIDCRSANRFQSHPKGQDLHVGFRVVLTE